jgi:signal transduction histidine kinase
MRSLQQHRKHTLKPPPNFLLNGGNIGSLLQSMDWSGSPLGPPHTWSAHLRAVMATLLPAQAQFVLFWGEAYVALYNDAYVPTIGSKHPQALGRPGKEHWSELWDDLEPLLRSVRETGQTFCAKDRPFYIERRGLGETVYFDVSYSAVREADGSVGGVLCLVAETTERVRFQQRQAFLLELGRTLPGLGEAERIEAYAVQRLAQELGAAQVCFGEDQGDGSGFRVAHDWADGVPSMVGQHDYATFGTSLREQLAAGQLVQQAYASQRGGLCATLHAPVLRGGRLEAMLGVHFHTPRQCFEDECQLVEETAKQIWAAITHARAERALHLLNESLEDRVAAVLAEREAATLQLHEAHKLEMIGQLTGGIAHDLNNMLTPIIASFELLRRHPHSERAPRLIDGGLQAAERARNLVGRLLSFARRQTLKPQPVSLAALVVDMRELIARSLGPTITVQVQIDPALPAVVADPHQLELALLNLVVNARDAMPDGGTLDITAGLGSEGPPRPAGAAARLIWLQVHDCGCGMDEEQLRRCIEPFYSTKGVGKGTGLGLPMVQGLALQSGGGFAIDSKPGQGTTATLWLPVSDVAAPCSDSEMPEAPQADRPYRVLLVDDEEIVRHATAAQLRDLGYDVTEAGNAAAALQLLEQGWLPDVLVTDHVMAEMTGVRFAQQMRERQADLPVLIITGYANLTPRELKGFEVLRKPYRQAELAQSVARLLANLR